MSSAVIKILSISPINQNTFRAGIVGIRPFRKGGIRLQKQQIKDKIIVHNYGHGGAGISLAPATAQQAVSLVLKEGAKIKHDTIAILGSGIIGLFSALQASQLGYQVKVYAKRIPQPKSYDSSKMCTSQVPPGYWLPYNYEFSDVNQHEKRSLKSFQQYLKLANRFPSIKLVDAYEPTHFKKQNLPNFMRKNTQLVNMNFGSHQQKMIRFKTLQINLQPFLQDLLSLCLKNGVQFIQTQLFQQNDIFQLPQKYIMNCLGFESKRIFNDTGIYGKKGYLLSYRNQNTTIPGIYSFQYQEYKLKFYILPDKIMIGITSEDSQNLQVDPLKVEKLKSQTYQFLSICGFGNHPKL